MDDYRLMALLAAAACAAIVLLWPSRAVRLRERLMDIESGKPAGPARVGIAAVIAAARAHVRSGGTLVGAFEEQAGHPFATPHITVERLVDTLMRRKTEEETESQVRRVAVELAASCALSDTLGCEAARCLDAVAAAQRRSRMIEDLRRQAYAMPQATVRLLSALPAVTVCFGEILGARPVAFLFGSTRGLACLAAGAVCYAIGMVWMRRLMRVLMR